MSDKIICPGCGKTRPEHDSEIPRDEWRDSVDAYGPCCHGKCGGEWGTGCYHCHHPSFWERDRDGVPHQHYIEDALQGIDVLIPAMSPGRLLAVLARGQATAKSEADEKVILEVDAELFGLQTQIIATLEDPGFVPRPKADEIANALGKLRLKLQTTLKDQ